MDAAIEQAISLGRALAKQQSNAYDLWSWLPSCKAAQSAHGDYYTEHMPSVTDVLAEAALFIGHGLKPNAEQRTEAGEFYRCPCGEDHDQSAD